MATVQILQEQRLLLHNISWDTYERLLADHENSSSPRFTYDRGELEIVSPLRQHERHNRIIQLLAPVVARELGIRVYSLGSVTLSREDLQRSVEADSCFYIQSLARIRDTEGIDLRVDPPPDLVVEIDISNPSIPKLPIYAQLGVPEVWRYDGLRLEVLRLDGERYVLSSSSRALGGVSAGALSDLIEECKGLDDFDLLERAPAWARELGSG